MKRITKLLRKDLRQFSEYSSARSINSSDNFINLDANENPYQPYRSVLPLNRYPACQPIVLLKLLSKLYGVKNTELLLTRGADEGIDLLIEAFTEIGEVVVITPPTFSYYKTSAELRKAKVIQIPLNKRWQPDIQKITAVKNCKLLFLCSPSNPLGNTIPLKTISTLASKLKDSLIIVDEAYIEYSNTPTAISLLNGNPNIVVLRTLSKYYALAGARIGSVIANCELVAILKKVIAPYPIPSTTIQAVSLALSPQGLLYAKKNYIELMKEKERVYQSLKERQIFDKLINTQTNFLLAFSKKSPQIYEQLKAAGILVRCFPELNALRISIGSPSENEQLLRSFL